MVNDELIVPAIVAAAVGALLAKSMLIPLAKSIPMAMQESWRHEWRAMEAEMAEVPDPARFDYAGWQRISWIALAGTITALVVVKKGTGIEMAGFSFYFLGLILLTAINLKSSLLPDVIVLGMLWVGLLLHSGLGNPHDQVLGAAVGYLVPYTILSISVRYGPGDFMGHGDHKTLAMAGAWFGLHGLPSIFSLFLFLMLAELALVKYGNRDHKPIPTGPMHLFASLGTFCGFMSA